MEEDSQLSLPDALEHTIWARNMEIGRLGRSPFQIVLGKSPSLPGLSDGTVVTDSIVTESDAVRMHFERQEWLENSTGKQTATEDSNTQKRLEFNHTTILNKSLVRLSCSWIKMINGMDQQLFKEQNHKPFSLPTTEI